MIFINKGKRLENDISSVYKTTEVKGKSPCGRQIVCLHAYTHTYPHKISLIESFFLLSPSPAQPSAVI